MTLTMIAVTGILVGFLCLIIGFFMEDAKDSTPIGCFRDRRAKTANKKVIIERRKAA